MTDSLPEPPRVDPAIVQAWRDRQLKNLPKDKLSMAEQITAANRLAALFDNPQTLTGGLTKTGAGGANVQVALDKPYKGLSTISAVAATGCDRFGRVTMLRDKNNDWYAFGGGTEKLRSNRDKERSGESDTTGRNIKYLVSASLANSFFSRPGSQQSIAINEVFYACGWQEECVKICKIKRVTPQNAVVFYLGGAIQTSFINTGGGGFIFTLYYPTNLGFYSSGGVRDHEVCDMVFAVYNEEGLVYEYIEKDVSDLPVNGFVWTGSNPYKNSHIKVLPGGKIVANFFIDKKTSYSHPDLTSNDHTIIDAYSGAADLMTAVANENPFTTKIRWSSAFTGQIRTHTGINYKSFTESISVTDTFDSSTGNPIGNSDGYGISNSDITGNITYGVASIGGTGQNYVGNVFLDPNPKPRINDEDQDSDNYSYPIAQYYRFYSEIFNKSKFCTVAEDGSIIFAEHEAYRNQKEKNLNFAFPPYSDDSLLNITNEENLNTSRQVATYTISVANKLFDVTSEETFEVFALNVVDVASAGALKGVQNPKDGDCIRIPSINRVYVYTENSIASDNGSTVVNSSASSGKWEATYLFLEGASVG